MAAAENEGFFIAIDGLDGTGKSTHVARLAEWMTKSGRPAKITREPGGTPAGEKIRNILLDSSMSLTPEAELLLFCADRAEHQKTVKSIVAEGVSVVCDRFLSSTWAYQIFGRGCPAEILHSVTKQTVDKFPDLTIILDLDIDIALKRAKNRLSSEGKLTSEGRFEAENTNFYNHVREGFLWYAKQQEFGKVFVIEATGDMDEVFNAVKDVCHSWLGI